MRAAYVRVSLEYPFNANARRHTTDAIASVTAVLKSKAVWSIKASMFKPRAIECDARDFFDTPAVMGEAFEADWRRVKVRCITVVLCCAVGCGVVLNHDARVCVCVCS